MRSPNRIALAAVALTGVLWSTRARADSPGFGADHPFVLSLEHLGGVSYLRVKFENQDPDTIVQTGLFTPILSPLTPQARLGLHYFVAPHVSLGALLGYIDNDALGTSYLVGARIGVAAPFSKGAALWLRAGALYTHTELGQYTKTTLTNVIPGGEALFVLRPDEHFAFLIGPMFEMGVAGKQKQEASQFGSSASAERSFDYLEVGLSFGVLTDF